MEPHAISENTPLIPATPPASESRTRNARTVTFSPDPVTKTFEPESYSSARDSAASAAANAPPVPPRTGQPVLTTLNDKLKRRNSHGSIPTLPQSHLGPKIGPQRSTKKTEKLKLLPNPDIDEDGQDEESGRDVYSQYTRIKDPTARRDAARLGKGDRDRLPRVTAYCTADKYQMESLMRFLKGRGKTRGANPKMIDECIYTPFSYNKPSRMQRDPVRNYERRHSTGGEAMEDEFRRHQTTLGLQSEGHESGYGGGDFADDGGSAIDSSRMSNEALLGPGVTEEAPAPENLLDFDTQVHTPEVFLFDYGVVVIWGMTESQEAKFLKELAKFELEKLAPDDIETERFNFYYTREYQARIYNDFITLRDKNNYMIKLAISHALAQSVKVRHQSGISSAFFFFFVVSLHFTPPLHPRSQKA